MNQTHTKVHEFLKHHPMGILSTVSENGKPWGSAIYYVADEDFNFFFVTRVDTFKYKNLEHKMQAALTVADPETQTTVQTQGDITKVPPQEYSDIVFDKLARIQPKDDINWVSPLMKVHKGDYIVLKLTPSLMQYANYKPFKTDIHADYIEKII